MSHQYQDLAALAKSFSDPNRLFILENLAQAPCAVEQLANKTALPIGNLSHHLQILKQSGLVHSRRNGRQIFYSITEPAVITALQGLRQLHVRLSAIDSQLAMEGALLEGPKILRSVALKLIKQGKAVLLDVRPLDEFNAGHIHGAVHIPLEELEARIDALPRDKVIVSYCRGPYCQLSIKATAMLAEHGLSAIPLEDGYPEWWAAGNPSETIDPKSTIR